MKFLIVEPFPLPILTLLGPNIRLRILFSNTLSLDSSLDVRGNVSQPYSTTGNIIVLYVLTQSDVPLFILFDNLCVIFKDLRAARPYLFSDVQNKYNRLVLVCTLNVYIPASLGWLPILMYQVLQVPTKLY